jgi:hypothetical protein
MASDDWLSAPPGTALLALSLSDALLIAGFTIGS